MFEIVKYDGSIINFMQLVGDFIWDSIHHENIEVGKEYRISIEPVEEEKGE
jgi:hypothetical protein